MFAISFAMLFGVAFISIFNLRMIAQNPATKNLLTLVMCGCNAVLSIAIAAVMNTNATPLTGEIIALLHDPRLYILIAFEILGLLVARQNFAHNHDNITAINFSMFLSIVYVPLIAYVLNAPLGFTDTLTVDYASTTEFILFVGSMLLLVVLFFANKIRGHINHWGYLLSAPLILSFCMFLSSKMMQTYNGFVVFFLVGLANCAFFSLLSLRQREHHQLAPQQRRDILKLAATGALFVPLNVLAISMIAVEFFTLLKRVAQVVCGRVFDARSRHSKPLGFRDTALVLMMLLIGLVFYALRG